MTPEETSTALGLMKLAEAYSLPRQRITTHRVAKAMNLADEARGITRPRKWTIGDEYALLATPDLKVVMVLR